jgi:D-alanyl-D-alanine dipeptidase
MDAESERVTRMFFPPMTMKVLFYIFITCIITLGCGCISERSVYSGYLTGANLPEGFVYLDKVIPNIVLEMRYASNNNFTGRRIAGYEAPKCILTRQAADALKNVQSELNRYSMSLKIYDGYRPQKAVDDFVRWWKDPSDIRMKNEYYPDVPRDQLFKEGYISLKSTHTRGSTVDLRLSRFRRRRNWTWAVILTCSTKFRTQNLKTSNLSRKSTGFSLS